MTRLLWKEVREKRVWTLLLTASVVGPLFFGKAHTFVGEFGAFASWVWLSGLVSLFLGLGTFSSELAGGTADFIFSRPVSWKRILLAKILGGLAVIVSAAVLTAIVYCFVRPEQYAAFVTVPRLAEGVGYAVWMMGSAYLVGVACSVVLPGVIGGMLVLLAISVAMGVRQAIFAACNVWIPRVVEWEWLLSAAIAAILVVRFGLTLTAASRAGRYALVVVAVVILATPLHFLLPSDSGWPYRESFVSPDGQYAIVHWSAMTDMLKENTLGSGYIVRLSDGKKATVTLPSNIVVRPIYWSKSNAVVFRWEGAIRTVQMDDRGMLHEHSIKIGSGEPSRMYLSPDRKLALVWSSDKRRGRLEFADIETRRKLDLVITDPKRFWWQSNTEVGYVDTEGKRRIVRVVE